MPSALNPTVGANGMSVVIRICGTTSRQEQQRDDLVVGRMRGRCARQAHSSSRSIGLYHGSSLVALPSAAGVDLLLLVLLFAEQLWT